MLILGYNCFYKDVNLAFFENQFYLYFAGFTPLYFINPYDFLMCFQPVAAPACICDERNV
jgi:hypothetical protein